MVMLMIIEKMYFYKNKSVTPCINQTVIIVLVNYEESIKIVNFLYPAWIRVLVLWLAIIDFKVKIYYFDILQHKAFFFIQLNADPFYPFACWSLCLLCLLILMLFILMLILIESRSMLIVYYQMTGS